MSEKIRLILLLLVLALLVGFVIWSNTQSDTTLQTGMLFVGYVRPG